MLVKDCMTRHPVMIPPETLASEVQKIMSESKIRHVPVVGDGKRLKGLITRQRLSLKPDLLGSLNVWEISRYLSNLKAQDMMLKESEVQIINPDRTVERAARIMADHKIGCLPVIEEDVVVGILSEVDLLRSYQLMLGLPMAGVRVTVRMPDQTGELAKIMRVLGERDLGVTGIGTYPTPKKVGFYDAVLKIPHSSQQEVREILGQIPGQEIVDIREGV
jgi:acetoin utilization protein AcuB